MFDTLPCLSVLLVLAVATYTDVRWRIIPNYITYSAMFLGVLFHVFFYRSPIFFVYAVSGVLLSYVLYKVGVWAGGDAKLFFAISLLAPLAVHGVPYYLLLILVSLLVGGVCAFLYSLWSLVTERRFRGYVKTLLLTAIPRGFSLGMWSHYVGFFSILFLILPLPLAFFSSLAVFLAYPNIQAVFDALYASLIFVFFYVFSLRGAIFSKRVPVTDLKEGDVLAGFVTDKGKYVDFTLFSLISYLLGKFRAVYTPFKAAGLSLEDIERMRELGVKYVCIKVTTPFVPFVLAAHILLCVLMHFHLWI